jgi:hypothetical protein
MENFNKRIKDEENPFTSIDHEGVMVPRYLLAEDRKKDLEAFMSGWNKQKARRNTRLVYGTADTYEDAGAVAYWTHSNAETEFSGEMHGGPGLDVTLHKMRRNPKFIPHEAWSDEDHGSDRIIDNGRDRTGENRYIHPNAHPLEAINTTRQENRDEGEGDKTD